MKGDSFLFPYIFYTSNMDFLLNSTNSTLNSKIKKAYRKYGLALDNLIEGCAILDNDWNILYVNEVNARHAHSTVQEMVGRKLSEVIPGVEDSDFFNAYRCTMEERKPQTVESCFEFNDGSSVWYQARSFPVPEGIIVQSMDITPQKQVENDLSRREEMFKTLADNISQLAWMADENGSLFWYNKRWYEYTGTTFEDVKGWGWKIVHHPDHINRVEKKFLEHISRGEAWEDTFPLRGKDGEFRWFLSRAQPVRNETNDIIRWFGTNTDITERKTAESNLKEAYRRIENQLAEKEVLLKELHHRTKNNMQIISSLLGLKAESVEDEVVKEIIRDIKTRIRSMALVHEKLYKAGSLSKINLGEYVKELALLISEGYVNESSRIKIDLNVQDTGILIDKAIPVGLIVTELVTNSFKHAFPENRGGKISIYLKKENGDFILVVKDDGIGFDREKTLQDGKLGLQLFESIAEGQLDAHIDLDNYEGVSWTLTFPVGHNKARI